MLLFCPQCSNILTISASPENGRNRLECRTCPYQHAIEEPMYSRRYFKKKEREDVFGGPEAWANADKTAVQCPTGTCEGKEAAFYQVQIRSADEPMTSFYKFLYDGDDGILGVGVLHSGTGKETISDAVIGGRVSLFFQRSLGI
ncbi:hypothetical protein CHU98_g1000 [Xylaria longipes]|nr:hypothetical protein CHU98_g1000 [Xylaria longipes]